MKNNDNQTREFFLVFEYVSLRTVMKEEEEDVFLQEDLE
jgi:hypothetical protein